MFQKDAGQNKKTLSQLNPRWIFFLKKHRHIPAHQCKSFAESNAQLRDFDLVIDFILHKNLPLPNIMRVDSLFLLTTAALPSTYLLLKLFINSTNPIRCW